MKRVVIRPAAAADIEDAYQWYETQQPGLGEQFLAACPPVAPGMEPRVEVTEHPA